MGLLSRLLGKPTIDEFGDRFVRALRQADPANEYRHEPAERRIVCARVGQKGSLINLANMHKTHLSLPRRDRAMHLRHCVGMALNMSQKPPSDFRKARPNLRSRLWTRAGLERIERKTIGSGSDEGSLEPPGQPIGEHLLACLAYDWPETVQSLSEDNLKEWGVTTYDALEAAVENLEKSTGAVSKIGDHLYSFVSGDTYDAARLMLVAAMPRHHRWLW